MGFPGLGEGLALTVAVAAAVAICTCGYPIGLWLGVLAEPDNCRKFHQRPTPQVGGIAILSGVVAWICVTLLLPSSVDQRLLYAVLLSGVGVGVIGFADDQTGLSPGARIIMVLVFLSMAFMVDRDFVSLRLNWGSFEPTVVPLWGYVPLMALTSGGVVNAVNMADGQDGVAGSMLMTWSGCLFLVTNGTSAELAAVICLLSLVFLLFNLRGKLFLGDCGSYGVTFVIGLLVTLAHARGQLSLETVVVWFFIPVADCLRLLIGRSIRGVSPFLGDRDHFHHRLESKMGKMRGLACYVGAVAISSLVATLMPRFALVCLCILCAFYFSFAWLTDENVPNREEGEPSAANPDNVVSLSGDAISDRRRQGAA